jgi:hypothetical protein
MKKPRFESPPAPGAAAEVESGQSNDKLQVLLANWNTNVTAGTEVDNRLFQLATMGVLALLSAFVYCIVKQEYRYFLLLFPFGQLLGAHIYVAVAHQYVFIAKERRYLEDRINYELGKERVLRHSAGTNLFYRTKTSYHALGGLSIAVLLLFLLILSIPNINDLLHNAQETSWYPSIDDRIPHLDFFLSHAFYWSAVAFGWLCFVLTVLYSLCWRRGARELDALLDFGPADKD